MIYIDELKDLKLYRKPFLLPRNNFNKLKGNMAFLLTPNYESSMSLLNNKMIINKYYKSYYLEKDVSLYINNEGSLERINDNDKYIHEEVCGNEVGVFSEGYYNRQKQVLIFNGYSSDIDETRKFISFERIEKLNQDLRAPIKYPISVTVYNKNDINVKSTASTLNIISYKNWNNSTDYDYYITEEIYEMLIRSINPNIDHYICECTILVLAGTYNLYKDELDEYKAGCDIIVNMLKDKNGYAKLYKLISKNDSNKIFKEFIKQNILEAEIDSLSKLKRNITYKSHKGSVHLLNGINRNIERTIDPSQTNPDFGIDKEVDIVNPTLDAVANQASSNGTQASESGKNNEPKTESYSDISFINNEVIVTENYIKANNLITYFNEENSNYSSILRKMLYKERIRTNKDMINIYDKVKEDAPNIKYTYLSYKRYKSMNIFIDLYYYNELFFKNNIYKLNKGANLYYSFLNNLLNNKSLVQSGYTGKKVILIPVLDWCDNPKTKMWIYTHDINPISIIYKLMNTDFESLKKTFGDSDVVFMTDKHYFKINFSTFQEKDIPKFLVFTKTLISGIDTTSLDAEDPYDSKAAIVDDIIDTIEDNQEIKLSHLTNKKSVTIKKNEETPVIKTNSNSANDKVDTSKKADEELQKASIESDKKKLVDKIEKAAEINSNVDDTLEALDNDDEFKKLLLALSDEEENGIQINNARSSRITKLDTELMDKEVRGKKVKDIIAAREKFNEQELETISLDVDSINPEWKELTYASMSNQYDPGYDIVAMLRSFSKMSYPISVRDISVTDASTFEDYKYTYEVDMEAHTGKRFKLRFDIPKLINGQYMKLGGNKKVISSQSFLMPILKTDDDTVQMISNYNKIFIRRFGTSTGKSNIYIDTIIKTLKKKKYSGIKLVEGDNSVICTKYELPIDYIDISSIYTTIETSNAIYYFNQKDFRELLESKKKVIDASKGLPVGIYKSTGDILYYVQDTMNNSFGRYLFYALSEADDNEFREDLFKCKPSSKHTYSKASILNTEIPVIILAAYSEGLIKVLDKSGIKYTITEKKLNTINESDYIKFNDGYLEYELTYQSSMLMNGLKECDTANYSVSEINNKSMYLDFLDQFGGRIKADGIDNFYDCFIDSITESVLEYYNLPTDYVQLLLHANNLLTDNKFIKHGDMSGRRLRRNEIIAGYTYKALSGAYGSYTTSMKHGRETILSMKQSAVIDMILLDPTSSDLSIINPLNEKESYDTVSTKGLSGMNSDRSYSLDKRAYDETMINVLGMSTGFATTVGINRQATINANVSTVRGYVKQSTKDDMNSVNSLCMSEALTPMGTTHDDPFRTAMTFIQTTKHGMRVRHADPSLITNGADQALPYLISDMFAYKAKSKGEVIELDDDHMLIKYDNETYDYVDLSETVEKNSSSGFYVVLKLDTDLKVGSKVKQGTLVAYDRTSFDPSIGIDDNPAYEIGTLVKCALMDTDEGFEDSAIISEDLSEAMTSDIIVKKELNINKNTNIYNLLPIGTRIEEGDTLMVMQSSFSEDDANTLLKNLAADEDEVSDLGRIPIKSKITGVIQDIEICRTVDMDELSESLQKLCKKYESKINSKKNIMRKYKIDKENELPSTDKLPATGKLKGADDGVQITFYLKYEDKMSIGDKLIYWSANKGVVKSIFPKGKEPYALSKPDEKMHCLVSIASTNARMVTSIQNVGVINNLLVEASRKAKDIAGIPWKMNLL